ncbi:ATP-binding protein [Mesorhizobium captivum]|uniref:ATP-binding protein n=1 Tax=Mesorhizobium captivum TaxID=3072319 RepID=UPI003D3155EF
MDALGQLTGGIVHDFNNLLTVVDSFVRIVKKVGTEPGVERATESVELALQRGTALTRQLLAFSRKQSARSEVVSLAERVEAVRGMIAGSVGKKVKLIANVGSETWPVMVDPGELELGVINIAFNARDAMPDGGLITITTENMVLSSDDIAAGLEGEFVALRVTDTGIGIAPDVVPQVFEPFFTTKGPETGTGLGLAQVYGFAQQSGGAVTIDSEVAKGTTVTIYLPRTDMATALQSSEAEQPTGANVVQLRTKGRFAASSGSDEG